MHLEYITNYSKSPDNDDTHNMLSIQITKTINKIHNRNNKN